VLLERALIEGGVAEAELQALRASVEQDVEGALERAKSWPDPTPQSRFENILA
jgi:TPP-dependent pyruvate/acetoin dehydrogenase alpha subunit